ncbi:MAG: hypothetical protein H6673_06130 [Anaerolineales bacterium]|nr:hypothetical protein [Anaerolineales bacterium]
MITPIDRETRKTLVRLAEQNSDLSRAARIILALTTESDEDKVALASRTSAQEVSQWRQRYEQEGLAIFQEAFASALPQVEPVIEPLPVVTDENTVDNSNVADNPDPDELTTEADPPSEERGTRRPRRSRRSSSPRDRRTPQEKRAAEAPSIEEAIFDGLETEMETLEAEELPPRQIVAKVEDPLHLEVVRPLPDTTHEPISVGALAAAYEVDMVHARHISQLARELFDATASVHRLSPHYRDLLHAAALLHNIAYDSDPDQHHRIGRDSILKYDLKDISEHERQMIAAMTALHRQHAVPQHEPTYQGLPDTLKAPTETLAALLRVGVGLDYSHTQSSYLVEWREAPGELLIVVGGHEATTDAVRAQAKSDLWNRLYSVAQLRFVTEEQIEVEDYIASAPPKSPDLEPNATAIDASNELRAHYVDRLDYLSNRIRHGDSGLLVSIWREYQRLMGVWEWLLPGLKPRQAFKDDAKWLSDTIQFALYSATLLDRAIGLLDETDPDQDDPAAIEGLKLLCDYYRQTAEYALQGLASALQSRRYQRWLQGVKAPLREEDTPIFSSQIAERAWAYLSSLRQTMNRVNRQGWNADLEQLLTVEVMQSFEVNVRRLTDLLIYSASLLGAEYEQTMDVLEPLLDFMNAWQRSEKVAQMAQHHQQHPTIEGVSPLVLEAFAMITRERANEMRWMLPEMWEPLNTAMFRRALALAVARP